MELQKEISLGTKIENADSFCLPIGRQCHPLVSTPLRRRLSSALAQPCRKCAARHICSSSGDTGPNQSATSRQTMLGESDPRQCRGSARAGLFQGQGKLAEGGQPHRRGGPERGWSQDLAIIPDPNSCAQVIAVHSDPWSSICLAGTYTRAILPLPRDEVQCSPNLLLEDSNGGLNGGLPACLLLGEGPS